MGSALWIAISGLNSSSKQMDVIGNNIANSNTMGFKSGKAYFANVLSQSLSGGSSGLMQIGQGVNIADVATSSARAPWSPPRAAWIWPSTAAASSSSKTTTAPSTLHVPGPCTSTGRATSSTSTTTACRATRPARPPSGTSTRAARSPSRKHRRPSPSASISTPGRRPETRLIPPRPSTIHSGRPTRSPSPT